MEKTRASYLCKIRSPYVLLSSWQFSNGSSYFSVCRSGEKCGGVSPLFVTRYESINISIYSEVKMLLGN